MYQPWAVCLIKFSNNFIDLYISFIFAVRKSCTDGFMWSRLQSAITSITDTVHFEHCLRC